MSTLPTRAIAHAYITEHDLQNILNRAVNACVHAKAADPIGFIIEHLKAVKEAAESNKVVAEEKEEAATTAVVPAVTSEFDWALLMAAYRGDLVKVEALLAKGADVKAAGRQPRMGSPRCTLRRRKATPRSSTRCSQRAPM